MTKPELQQKFEGILGELCCNKYLTTEVSVEAMKQAASLMLDLAAETGRYESQGYYSLEIEQAIVKLKELL